MVPSASQAIDRLEAGHTWELGVHRFNNDDVATGSCRTQTLMGEQCIRRLPSRVVGECERALRVVRGRSPSSGDVTTGGLDESFNGRRVGRHALELARFEEALDDLASLVPPRHPVEGTGSREAVRSEPVG